MGHRRATWWSTVAAAMCGVLLLAIAADVTEGHAFAAARRQANAKVAGTTKTVLDGVFTAAQAERGAAAYDEHCALCHDGADVDGPPLTGAPFIDRWREDTLDGLFDFMKTRMPQSAPGSLSEAAYLDILAHLLHESDFPAGSQELTLEAVRGTLLVGPSGPQPLPSGALVRVVGCVTQSAAKEWIIARAGQPARAAVGTEITEAEATAAAAAALGTQTFTLQNVGDGGTPLPAEGQKAVVKGALIQRAGTAGIHVTAAKSVAATCG